MKKKAFLVINIFKAEEMNANKVAGIFWRKKNAKKFIRQLMEENADFIEGQLYKIEKYIFPEENSTQNS